jgi:hypothetical protein
VAKFPSPEYVAVIVSAAVAGKDATHNAVVFPAEVLNGLAAHRFTGVRTLLLV